MPVVVVVGPAEPHGTASVVCSRALCWEDHAALTLPAACSGPEWWVSRWGRARSQKGVTGALPCTGHGEGWGLAVAQACGSRARVRWPAGLGRGCGMGAVGWEARKTWIQGHYQGKVVVAARRTLERPFSHPSQSWGPGRVAGQKAVT